MQEAQVVEMPETEKLVWKPQMWSLSIKQNAKGCPLVSLAPSSHTIASSTNRREEGFSLLFHSFLAGSAWSLLNFEASLGTRLQLQEPPVVDMMWTIRFILLSSRFGPSPMPIARRERTKTVVGDFCCLLWGAMQIVAFDLSINSPKSGIYSPWCP